MIFSFGSTMKLSRNWNITFVDNYATLTGGAIHLTSSNSYRCPTDSSSSPECFLQPEQTALHQGLLFVNNSAGQGGNALYGKILGNYAYIKDGHTYVIKCSSLFKIITSITPNTLSQVASDPYRVCICNNSTPECHMTSMAVDPIFPGQSFSISTVVVGEQRGTVAGSVFASFLPLNSIQPQLEAGEDTKGVTQPHCTELEYTIFSTNTKEVLVLTTFNREESITVNENTALFSFREFPFYVHISLLPCPAGFSIMETSAKCDCSQFVLQLPGVSCNIKDQTIHRSGLVWLGSIKDENQTVENVITAKYCPLNYCKHEDISVD